MSTFGTARLTTLADVVEAAFWPESGAIMTSATAIAAAAITASLELRFIGILLGVVIGISLRGEC
jgi:hypothetical protein